MFPYLKSKSLLINGARRSNVVLHVCARLRISAAYTKLIFEKEEQKGK